MLAAYARWDVQGRSRSASSATAPSPSGYPRTRHLHSRPRRFGNERVIVHRRSGLHRVRDGATYSWLRLDGVDRRPNVGFFDGMGRRAHVCIRLKPFSRTSSASNPRTSVPRSHPQRTPNIAVIGTSTRSAKFDTVQTGEDVEHLRHRFRDAVRARLRGLEQVGVFLSGGLDSSSSVAMTARTNAGDRPVAVNGGLLADLRRP